MVLSHLPQHIVSAPLQVGSTYVLVMLCVVWCKPHVRPSVLEMKIRIRIVSVCENLEEHNYFINNSL